MSAEVQKQVEAKAVPQMRAIKSVRFVASVPFGGTESEYVLMGLGKCDRVFAARIDSDGTALPITANQRADGLLFERDFVRGGEKKSQTEAVFVAWANIRGVVY